MDHGIGPVWEANHAWLIYVLVMWWTGFPKSFASAMSTLILPMLFALLGAVAGAIAWGRVPVDGRGDLWSSWLNPTSILGGVIAVGTCPMSRSRDRSGSRPRRSGAAAS